MSSSSHRARAIDDPVSRQAVIDALRDGLSYETAASIIGVSRKQLHNLRKAEPEFNRECIEAIGLYERQLVAKVNDAAEEDAKAAQWLLERRFPKRWSGRIEVHQFGAEDEDPRDEDEEDMSDEELERRARGETE